MKNEILQILKERKTYVSGQELAKTLGVSRTAVWKNIAALKKAGYNISSVPNRGYLLDDTADILNEKEIVSDTGFYFAEVLSSTNDTAKEFALKGCEEFFFVTCNQQTGGKGRLGRTWISPKNKNIYLSMVLHPNIDITEVPQITLVIGLALAKTLSGISNADIGIKWPNDVLINCKKAVGILTEMQAEIDRILFVAAGIGVNVNQTEFDDEIKDKATSLCIECGRTFKRSEIISEMIANIKYYYKIFTDKGFAAVRDEYKALCLNLGKEVTAAYKGQKITGFAEDISKSGELVIRKDNNESVYISSGEASVRLKNNEYI